MKKHKLSKRLLQMAKWIEKDSTIADIGTDHGYLPYYLFDQKIIRNAILCDINSGPLDNAKSTFNGSKYLDNTSFRLGSGIEPLSPNEVDFVVIAGMGGSLIKDILNKDLAKSQSFRGFFLQPQTEQEILRKWLLENQFEIIFDFYAFEDQKYYEAIYVRPINNIALISNKFDMSIKSFNINETSNDLEFGYRVHFESLETYKQYIQFKREKYKMIQSKVNDINNQKSLECLGKIEIIDQLISNIEKFKIKLINNYNC